MNVFSGYISEGWRGFFPGHRPKVEGYLEQLFFESSQRAAGEIFRKGLTKSRRLSGAVLFRVIAAGRWRDFLRSIDQKLEAVWSCTFSGYRNGPLGEPRDRCGKAAGGCLAGTSFRGTFPKAGVAFRRGSPQSWRRPGLNVFSGYISGCWRDFLQRIDPKPKAVWREYFFGVHFRTLARLFAEN